MWSSCSLSGCQHGTICMWPALGCGSRRLGWLCGWMVVHITKSPSGPLQFVGGMRSFSDDRCAKSSSSWKPASCSFAFSSNPIHLLGVHVKGRHSPALCTFPDIDQEMKKGGRSGGNKSCLKLALASAITTKSKDEAGAETLQGKTNSGKTSKDTTCTAPATGNLSVPPVWYPFQAPSRGKNSKYGLCLPTSTRCPQPHRLSDQFLPNRSRQAPLSCRWISANQRTASLAACTFRDTKRQISAAGTRIPPDRYGLAGRKKRGGFSF
jgi:hypothetical protein